MKKFALTCIVVIIVALMFYPAEGRNSHYITNRPPLSDQPYTPLPLGTIKARGMLLKMLELQRDGLTGHLDSIYSIVCGDNNGWLGGIGDGWERGPYWIDGLVPLAWILEDNALKTKAEKWLEWSLANQQENGYFGPRPLPEGTRKIPGTQQENREDWWPKMVMLKALQQYYTATADPRIITLMLNYCRYQEKMLPSFPLGHWTFWGNRRGADNLAVVYWLYNVTGEEFLLRLGETIHQQTYDWTDIFSGDAIRRLNPLPDLHCVNVAQGLKAPAIYYQHHQDQKYLDAVRSGMEALKECHGFVNGMFGGDESLHGNDPVQGSELCSVVEMMFSLESILPVTGDVYYADHLEKIAYNVLPSQATDDFMRKQYFQQANQVRVTDEPRNFFNNESDRLVFGTTSGYPCCLANMHQGWPKFIQNMWYATPENGIAALVYGPSEVTAKVAGGEEVTITEITEYPFREDIRFLIKTNRKVKFPFHLRVPLWCGKPSLRLNGVPVPFEVTNNIIVMEREWSSGDTIHLNLPMDFRFSHWAENSMGIERGSLVYALRISEEWREITKNGYDDTFWEVLPKSPWNYALLRSEINKNNLQAEISGKIALYPWNPENAPVQVKIKARRVPAWNLERGSAGNIPVSAEPETGIIPEEVVLIPYGCTTLRISQFPVF